MIEAQRIKTAAPLRRPMRRSSKDDVAVIHMTTTTRGCPATQYLLDAVRERALDTGVSRDVEVRLTYDPPWNPEMMQT